MPENSFERLYLEKVALGEGCGCAEQVIGTRDLERRAKEAASPTASRGGALAWIFRLLRRQVI